MDGLMYNPDGMSTTNQIPMKTVEKLKYLNSIEDISRYKFNHSLGSYYPVRFLTGKYIDKDSEWPIVMVPGTIVSIIPIKDSRAYTEDDDVTGIRAGGTINTSISVKDDSPLKRSVDLMYPRDMAGFITIANGGVETIDTYSDADGEAGILTISGTAAASGDTFIRPANTPIGIVSSRVYADMRERFLNYDVEQKPVAIDTAGVLTLPFISIYGEGDRSALLQAVRNSVNDKHQYVWVDGDNKSEADEKLELNAKLIPDPYGRFTADNGGNPKQVIGKVLELRNRIPYGIDEIIDFVPGSGKQGTDTGGLPSRIYFFIHNILRNSAVRPPGYSLSKENIKKILYQSLETNTPDVTIEIGQVNIMYGFII